MKRLAIVGAGDLGIQLLHISRLTQKYDAVYFFDDYIESGSSIKGIPVLGRLCEIQKHYKQKLFDEIILAIGYNHLAFKKKIADELNDLEVPFATLIHPRAMIDPSSVIAPGVVLYQGCIIDMNVTIGANTIIHCGCIISHDAVIGANCFLSPGVNVAGHSKIGDQVRVGIGTSLIDRISVCSETFLGAGSLVLNNISESGIYYGSPAKLQKGL